MFFFISSTCFFFHVAVEMLSICICA